MLRRELLKAFSAAAIPTLPAIAGASVQLGPRPTHSDPELRATLTEYIDAYRSLHITPHYHNLDEWWRLRDLWLNVRGRLERMVCDNCGRGYPVDAVDYNDPAPSFGLAACAVDLGDVLVIVAVDDNSDDLVCQPTGIVLLPRSQAMFELIDGLPKFDAPDPDDDEDEDVDDMPAA